MRVFDASSYFTRRQSDLRYVHNPLTAAEVTALFTDTSGNGMLPGSVIAPQTVTGKEIADAAIGLQKMLGDIRPVKIIPAGQELPVISPPDSLYPEGAQVYWVRDGKLYINRGNTWTVAVRAPDLTGVLNEAQLQGAIKSTAAFASSLRPIELVDSLPTISQVGGVYNYDPGAMVFLKSTSKLYSLDADRNWKSVVNATDMTGVLSRDKLDATLVNTASFAQTLQNTIIVAGNPDLSTPANQTKYPVGMQVFNTVDGKLYRSTGTAWTPVVDTSHLTGTLDADRINANWLTAGAITAGAIGANELSATGLKAKLIAANNIVSDLLNANTITTTMMTANTINGDRIQTGTLAATKITADWLDAGAIKAGAISTNELNADGLKAKIAAFTTVIADVVNAAKLTTTMFQANTIDGSVITAGTLGADKIKANSITSGLIQAGAITTDKLIVGSFDNLMEDGGFALPTGSGPWIEDGAGARVWPGYARTGSYSFVKPHGSTYGGSWPSTTDSAMYNRMVFDVKDGDKLYLEAWAAQWGADGFALLRVYFFSDRQCTSSTGTIDLTWFNAAECNSTWAFHSGITTPVPAGSRWARVCLIVTAQHSGLWSIDDVFVKKAVSSTYISGLTADMITTGTLDCTNLSVVNLSASSIRAGTLTVDKLNITSAMWKDVVLTSDVADAGGAGIMGISWHGAAGLSAPVTLVADGVLYTLPAGQTASRYISKVLDGTNSAFIGTDDIPPTSSGAYRQIVVMMCLKSLGHATAKKVDFSSLVGNGSEFAIGDTIVQLAGAYDPGTNSNVGLWIKNTDTTQANWLRTRITHQFVSVMKGGELNGNIQASMGYQDDTGGFFSINQYLDNGLHPFLATSKGTQIGAFQSNDPTGTSLLTSGKTSMVRKGGIQVRTSDGSIWGYVPIVYPS